MTSFRSAVVAIAFMAAFDAAPARAAGSSHVSTDASTTTQATRLDCADYAGPCEQPQHVRGDQYVFAATRDLRESGIHPAIAVAIAPATLAVDALLFPFALALEHLAN